MTLFIPANLTGTARRHQGNTLAQVSVVAAVAAVAEEEPHGADTGISSPPHRMAHLSTLGMEGAVAMAEVEA